VQTADICDFFASPDIKKQANLQLPLNDEKLEVFWLGGIAPLISWLGPPWSPDQGFCCLHIAPLVRLHYFYDIVYYFWHLCDRVIVSIRSGKLSFHDWKSQGILLQKTCRNPVRVWQLGSIADRTILEADKDNDGMISFTEFVRLMEDVDVEQQMSIRFLNWIQHVAPSVSATSWVDKVAGTESCKFLIEITGAKNFNFYCRYISLQEIRANAHETCESLQQFLFAGHFGLSPSISLQFTLLQPKIT